jgi:hypothetical protein
MIDEKGSVNCAMIDEKEVFTIVNISFRKQEFNHSKTLYFLPSNKSFTFFFNNKVFIKPQKNNIR